MVTVGGATAVLQCSAGNSVDAALRPETVVVHAYMSIVFPVRPA